MDKNELRRAVVLFQDEEAGLIEETDQGYRFTYKDNFIKKNKPISISLPLTQKVYESSQLFPFFTGLLPEGW